MTTGIIMNIDPNKLALATIKSTMRMYLLSSDIILVSFKMPVVEFCTADRILFMEFLKINHMPMSADRS